MPLPRHLVTAAALVLVSLLIIPASGASSNGYAIEIATETNAARVHNGLPQVKANDCLQYMAHRQARRMATRGSMFHQDPRRVQEECGMDWVRENLAAGYHSGEATVRAWMDSSSHRANILDARSRLMGVGAVKRDGTWWVAQVFGARA